MGSPLFSFLSQHKLALGLAILLVGMMKVFAVALTLNAGGNGGNFAPALLAGSCLGFSFSFFLNESGLTNLPISNFCLVAMAGMLAGIFHAPLTALFLIAEITGGYDLIIPLMIVSALSTSVSKYMNPKSLDEEKLKIQNQLIPFSKDVHVLSGLSLSEFIETDFAVLPSDATLRTIVAAITKSKRNIFPVVNKQGQLEGVIVMENIREIMFDQSLYDTKLASNFMQKPITCNMDDDMNTVMEKFDKNGTWNFPVLDREGKYCGFISKSRVFSDYRDRLKID